MNREPLKSLARKLEQDEHNHPIELLDKFTEAGFHGRVASPRCCIRRTGRASSIAMMTDISSYLDFVPVTFLAVGVASPGALVRFAADTPAARPGC